MQVAIILNGISRKKKLFYKDILPVFKQRFSVEVFETQYSQHAIELAAAASHGNFDVILAAGGDGTLNQVLNGVLQSQEQNTATVGIVPLGTGNDFAKMCGIKANADQIAKLVMQNTPKSTDIGKISCCDEQGRDVTKYFINVCSVGMGPEVVKRLMKSDRSFGPLLTYLKAITTTFFRHLPQEIVAKAPHWEWRGKVRVLAVANGQSFGNSMYVAPNASPDDGLFSTFIAGDLQLLKFLWCLQQVKGKKKIKATGIMYNECASIEVTAPVSSAIEAEGEWMGWTPLKIEMLPQRIKFLR